MKRSLLVLGVVRNAVAILPLILCAATVALWVRSYWVTDSVRANLAGGRPVDRAVVAASSRGLVWVERWRAQVRLGSPEETTAAPPTFSVSTARSPIRWVVESGDSDRSWDGIAGFRGGERRYVGSGNMSTLRYVVLPHWAVAGVLAVLAVPALRGWFSRRRSRGGCPACGYERRASPGRCPECGTVAKA